MVRFARDRRVFFIEEPVFGAEHDFNEISKDTFSNVHIIVPHLSDDGNEISMRQKQLLDALLLTQNIQHYITWYYTPMAFLFSSHLQPQLLVFDCMDELSAFRFAPSSLKVAESRLLEKADIVFTGGHSLYNAKKAKHNNIYSFPSSIDKEHFYRARENRYEPDDQKELGHPRLGFYGVIDERFDIDLIEKTSAARPDWHFIFIGPVVKIDPLTLPQKPNIHYLGSKTYSDLPVYLSGWDICLIPFVLDESTRFISPTKTPEYLAAGKPVISTAITDVTKPYGDLNLVYIVGSAEELISAAQKEFSQNDKTKWLEKVDDFLADLSWDKTYEDMVSLMNKTMEKNKTNLINGENYV